MHPKLKNNLVGLAVAAGFVVAGALMGDPLPAHADAHVDASTAAASGPVKVEVEVEPGFVVVDLEVDRDEPPVQPPRRTGGGRPQIGLRRHLSMPYYSFARLLPRTAES